MPDQVVVTDDDGVRIVRMNRPDKKNALTQPMYAEMTRALREAEGSDTIHCIIFAGSPGAFCAGSDISDFQKRAEGGLKPITVDFLHALVRNPKPLVAAVDGARHLHHLGRIVPPVGLEEPDRLRRAHEATGVVTEIARPSVDAMDPTSSEWHSEGQRFESPRVHHQGLWPVRPDDPHLPLSRSAESA